MSGSATRKIVATNRKARYNYEILDTYEAGLVLLGSEVKSLRAGHANFADSYGHIRDGEAYLVGFNIAPYAFAREGGHEPDRTRKLLLNRREIDRIRAALDERGLTLVPLSIYFRNGKAKVELGLGKGKRAYDKRQTIKDRDTEREMRRLERRR